MRGALLGMTSVQKADPAARRQAVLLVVVGALVGALFLVGFERYRAALLDWFLSYPKQLAYRLRFFFILAAVSGSAPLFALAVYLWSLGGKVMRAQRFPPPGHRVYRDTPILEGHAAIARGRGFKRFAVFLGVASALLWCAFWRLASTLVERAA